SKMAVPFLTGLAIDQIRWTYDPWISSLRPLDEAAMQTYLILIGLFIILGAAFRYFFDFFTSYLGARIVKKMRLEAYEAIANAPISYLDSHPHGDILLRLTSDIESVQSGLITGAGALYEGIVQILITLGFMFAVNWALALTVIVLTPISVVVSRFISNHNAVYFKAQSAKLGALTADSLESITNLESLQAYGLENAKQDAFDLENQAAKVANFRASFAASWINPCTRLVNNTIYAAVILFGMYMLLAEPSWLGITFTVGGLSGFLTYSHQYMTPFNEIADAASDLFYADASLGRVMEVILAPKDVDEGKRSLGETIESLEAKGMVFSYDGKRKIIDGFSLDVYKGHKIALVGTTGCGKTTIINLLMRFYDPQEGGFFVNGISTQDTPKKELRSHIGMVLQETWLAKASIAENIAYGNPSASREEIIEAAEKAHADAFIRRLKDGYDTVLGAESELSTGEKQLLCVARILLAKPEIVLLDEATSNIDLRTELALSQAFDELMKGKTSLVVAHRLSTIKNADLILVMDQGRIIEQGNFKELMEKRGFFAELYEAQLA
ncbi:MAG: ABC transporter ATP-binding protein, partial [Bacilli bacterium]|nr:ABC transporter ATP-binding protein [Bacilli bacterium]